MNELILNERFSDEYFMRQALVQAKEAELKDEVPVGAVIVWKNKIIARAGNQVESLKDGTAHAEMIALTQAAAAVGDWRLTECRLYVSKEPCAMCAGAMVNCRLGKLFFACYDERMGAAGSAMNITGFSGMLHRVEVQGGLLEEEASEMLKKFFQRRRKEN